jgi:hypothetical protein
MEVEHTSAKHYAEELFEKLNIVIPKMPRRYKRSDESKWYEQAASALQQLLAEHPDPMFWRDYPRY